MCETTAAQRVVASAAPGLRRELLPPPTARARSDELERDGRDHTQLLDKIFSECSGELFELMSVELEAEHSHAGGVGYGAIAVVTVQIPDCRLWPFNVARVSCLLV